MKVTVYNGISDAHEVREIKDGFPLKTALSEEECSRALAFINGRKASVSDVPKEGDGVLIRVMPGASVATAFAIGALAVSVIGGAVAGYKMYQQKKALAKMQEEMSDLNEKTNSKVDNRPFLRGAGNSVATGKSQPYVMGRHMFTPYLLTHKWYELEGELGQDQFVTQCLECGFNKLVFETINADEVNLKSFDPTEAPQEGDGTLDDCPLLAAAPTRLRRMATISARLQSATRESTARHRKSRFLSKAQWQTLPPRKKTRCMHWTPMQRTFQ